MSGIAGAFHLDGSSADLGAIRRMIEALAWRGPDGSSYWHSGPIGFAHAQFCTTPESLDENQPLSSPDATLCITFDGRIDNRETILEALRSKGVTAVDHTDPGLVMGAYRLWGHDCLQHIVGDFAFALWDSPKRTLWCARDAIGIRPFYYAHRANLFLFSSDIRSLLTHSAVSSAVNEAMIAEYLAFNLSSRNETLYRDIRRLPASSTITLGLDGCLRVTNWWRPVFSLINYKGDDEYAAHFTNLIEESVRARMRAHGGWGCQLSGGLDSTTVAATAQTLLNRHVGSERVRTFSTVAPGKPWDESEYIACTTAFWNLQSHAVPPLKLGFDFYRQEAAQYRDFPGYPNSAPMIAGVYNEARKQGVRVLLTGHGGNHLLEGNLSHLADLALSGSPSRLLRVGKEDWEIYGRSGSLYGFLFRKILLHLVPETVRVWRTRRKLIKSIPIGSEFVKRTRLANRVEASVRPDVRGFASRAQRSVFQGLQSGEMLRAQEIIDRVSTAHGIEERHPFLDRRVIEFCLRIPEKQRQRGTVWKWILRTAMKDKLPDAVLHRTEQAEFSEFYGSAVSDPEARRTLADLHMLGKTDWVNLPNVLTRASEKCIPADIAMKLWMFIGIELWLEALATSQEQE